MHLIMIFLVLGIAGLIRLGYTRGAGTWESRWQHALLFFLCPPLLILSTTIALLFMGGRGQMMGLPSSWISYAIATFFCLYSLLLILRAIWQGIIAVHKISTYPTQIHFEQLVHVIAVPNIFAAQVGFWQPKLVVSQALLQEFDLIHLNAVLKHEEAHLFYRDTFWFFGLGCLRQISHWLPNSDNLWQELLLLRELRADRWATTQVEALVLAESLLWTVRDLNHSSDSFFVALDGSNLSRLEERIEMLLSEFQEPEIISNQFPWGWLTLTWIPLTSVLLHS